MSKLCFIDTETTGLDHERHYIFEIAVIAVDEDVSEHHWWMEVDLSTADPNGLRLNRYYSRRKALDAPVVPRAEVAAGVAPVLAESVLIGANPAFDERFLARFLRAHGQAPAWHYRVFDIEAAAAAIAGVQPPWGSSTELCAQAVGVTMPDEDRHTAMGDCRWAKAVYDAVYHRQLRRPQARRRVGATKPDAAKADVSIDRSPHHLLAAPPKVFSEAVLGLDDPVLCERLLSEAETEGVAEERIAALRAQLSRLREAEEGEQQDEGSDEAEITPSGRPSGMPGPEERPICEMCGEATEGPPKRGAPSAAQLSWTRYRRILCLGHLEAMRVAG